MRKKIQYLGEPTVGKTWSSTMEIKKSPTGVVYSVNSSGNWAQIGSWMPDHKVRFYSLEETCISCGHLFEESLQGWGCLKWWEFNDDGTVKVQGCPCINISEQYSQKD